MTSLVHTTQREGREGRKYSDPQWKGSPMGRRGERSLNCQGGMGQSSPLPPPPPLPLFSYNNPIGCVAVAVEKKKKREGMKRKRERKGNNLARESRTLLALSLQSIILPSTTAPFFPTLLPFSPLLSHTLYSMDTRERERRGTMEEEGKRGSHGYLPFPLHFPFPVLFSLLLSISRQM